MIKAIIVDDEIAAIEIVETLVRKFSEEIIICKACTEIEEAIREIRKHEPDIIFLDIELRDGLGFDILEAISEMEARIIFVTAHDHYAIKAIKFHAFEYILKPIIPEELHEAIEKVLLAIRKKNPKPDSLALLDHLKGMRLSKIAVPHKNGLHYYNIDNIVLIEADGSYTLMHLADKKSVMVCKKLKDFEETLSGTGFLRVHKSFLVNLNHIHEFHRSDSGYLVMSNGKKVAISQKDKEEIFALIRKSTYTI
jgi:two-component system LytT family response regulator